MTTAQMFSMFHSVLKNSWQKFPSWSAIGKIWNIGNALLFLPFYALGNCCKGLLSRLEFRTPPGAAIWVAMAAASIVVMVQAASLRESDPQMYHIVRIGAGLMVIPCYFCLAKWIAGRCGHRRVIEFVVVSGTVYLGLQNYCEWQPGQWHGQPEMLMASVTSSGIS